MFHHNFEYLVILTTFECLNQMPSTLSPNSWTVQSRASMLVRFSMLSLLIESMSWVINLLFSLLFLTIVCFLVRICSSLIAILIVSRAWSEESLYSEWIIWLSNSNEFGQKNMRLITEFESLELLEYLVRTWLVDLDTHKFIESTMFVIRLN